MPQYSVRCETCGESTTVRLTFRAYDAVKTGAESVACACGGTSRLEFDPSSVSFSLKDGASGGWVSKATRENAYRANRRSVMGQRERDHVAPKRLVPNYRGQEVATWSEAKDAAYQSTYQRVKGEHGDRAAAVAAAESARTYERHVKQEGSG